MVRKTNERSKLYQVGAVVGVFGVMVILSVGTVAATTQVVGTGPYASFTDVETTPTTTVGHTEGSTEIIIEEEGTEVTRPTISTDVEITTESSEGIDGFDAG